MMRYIKADKKVIDALFEDNVRSCDTIYSDSFYWTERRQSYWECNECGWAISYVDDCVITSSHDFWKKDLTHLDKEAGIYHAWCRKLCSNCHGRLGPSGHPRCDKIIKEQETKARLEMIDNRIESADDEMYNNLLKVK